MTEQWRDETETHYLCVCGHVYSDHDKFEGKCANCGCDGYIKK